MVKFIAQIYIKFSYLQNFTQRFCFFFFVIYKFICTFAVENF